MVSAAFDRTIPGAQPQEQSEGALLNLDNVTVSFDSLKALNQLTMNVPLGDITSVIGPNGAGKTTLFNVITGVRRPDNGTVKYKGHELTRLSPQDVVKLGLCRTFQDVRLFNRLPVLDNVLVSIPDQPGENIFGALFTWRENSRSTRKNKERAMELLEFVGMEQFANTLAEDLSYGQQKLVALARILATDADTLLLDEPASGLDASKIEQMLVLVNKLVDMGKTILLIEHNIDLVIDVSDRVIVMHEGQVIVEGTPQEVVADDRVLEAYLGE